VPKAKVRDKTNYSPTREWSLFADLLRDFGGAHRSFEVSLLPVPGAIGARRIASKRRMKISDSIDLLPGSAM
jgi:hypothetical protein